MTVLTALPGVGELTALVMVAEIGDITPFPTARKLTALGRADPGGNWQHALHLPAIVASAHLIFTVL